MKSNISNIRISLFYNFQYSAIFNDELFHFEDVGTCGMKPSGNNILAFDIFEYLVANNLNSQIPEKCINNMNDFLQKFEYPEIPEQQEYRHDESFYYINDKMYKDIAGSWGPENWDYNKGTHLKIKFDQGKVIIEKIGIEDEIWKILIELNPLESFIFASNTLLQGNYGFFSVLFHNSSQFGIPNYDPESLQSLKSFTQTERDRLDVILKYLISYYEFCWEQVEQSENFIEVLLQLNGINTIACLLYNHLVIHYIAKYFRSNEQVNKLNNLVCILICIQNLLIEDDEILQYFLEISKIKQEDLNKFGTHLLKNNLNSNEFMVFIGLLSTSNKVIDINISNLSTIIGNTNSFCIFRGIYDMAEMKSAFIKAQKKGLISISNNQIRLTKLGEYLQSILIKSMRKQQKIGNHIGHASMGLNSILYSKNYILVEIPDEEIDQCDFINKKSHREAILALFRYKFNPKRWKKELHIE